MTKSIGSRLAIAAASGRLNVTHNESQWSIYSRIYDIYYGDYDHDINYLRERWQKSWRAILEVGAGTGRLIDFFIEQGVTSYLGVDTSPEMLSIALAKSLPSGFSLSEMDILTGQLDKRFDFIMYPFNTANYILQPVELVAHLRKCRQCLCGSGHMLLDLYVPFALTRKEAGADYRLREKTTKNGVDYALYDRRHYESDSQMEDRHHKSVRSRLGKVQEEMCFRTRRRYYAPDEVRALARAAGLEAIDIRSYGDISVEGFYLTLVRNQ